MVNFLPAIWMLLFCDLALLTKLDELCICHAADLSQAIIIELLSFMSKKVGDKNTKWRITSNQLSGYFQCMFILLSPLWYLFFCSIHWPWLFFLWPFSVPPAGYVGDVAVSVYASSTVAVIASLFACLQAFLLWIWHSQCLFCTKLMFSLDSW